MISSIVGKAIKIHGGLRLASAKESRFSATFISRGQNEIQVSIASGFPKKVSSTYRYNESNINLSIAKACDKLVWEVLRIPGFSEVNYVFFQIFLAKKRSLFPML